MVQSSQFKTHNMKIISIAIITIMTATAVFGQTITVKIEEKPLLKLLASFSPRVTMFQIVFGNLKITAKGQWRNAST